MWMITHLMSVVSQLRIVTRLGKASQRELKEKQDLYSSLRARLLLQGQVLEINPWMDKETYRMMAALTLIVS